MCAGPNKSLAGARFGAQNLTQSKNSAFAGGGNVG